MVSFVYLVVGRVAISLTMGCDH